MAPVSLWTTCCPAPGVLRVKVKPLRGALRATLTRPRAGCTYAFVPVRLLGPLCGHALQTRRLTRARAFTTRRSGMRQSAIVTQRRLTQKQHARRLGRVFSTTEPPHPTSPHERARAILAVNLIRLRQARGWSQEALAHEAGLHRTFVAHVERQVRNISLDNVERLAAALGVSAWEMLKPGARASAG